MIQELAEAAAACDGVRLQMLGLAMALPQRRNDMETAVTEIYENPLSAVGAVTQEAGGLMHARALGSNVMMVPKDTRKPNFQEYMETVLQELYETENGSYNWILDFSAITYLSPLFLGTMYAYKQDLKRHGKDLYVAWLSPSALAPSLTERAMTAFDLTQVGHSLFSRARTPVRYVHGS